MSNEVISQHYISVTFSAVVSSRQIEWEILVLVVSDQDEWFLRLPVLYESVDRGVLERLVIRLHQFRGRFATTKCRSVL